MIVGKRQAQEDDYLVASFDDADTDGCILLAIVADGMGGHAGGAEASHRAINGFHDAFRQSEGSIPERLEDALNGANDRIKAAGKSDEFMGMGCTLVACAVTEGGEAHWISVGDSLLLHLRGDGSADSTIAHLNEDHSARPEFEKRVAQGRLTPEQFKTAPVHQLYSALMGRRIEEIDKGSPPVRLQPGDRLIVATDGIETLADPAPGLPATVRFREIQALCGNGPPMDAVVSELLAAINDRAHPHQDNATVVAYRHPEGRLPDGIGKEFRTLLGPRP